MIHGERKATDVWLSDLEKIPSETNFAKVITLTKLDTIELKQMKTTFSGGPLALMAALTLSMYPF